MIRSLFTNVRKISIFELIFAFITPAVIWYGIASVIFPFIEVLAFSDVPSTDQSNVTFTIILYAVSSILYLISIFIPSFIIGWRHKSDKVFFSLFTTLFFSWIGLWIVLYLILFFGDKILTALHL